ncbi:MAG: VanZ family protein [Acidimicrobiia bacterium]
MRFALAGVVSAAVVLVSPFMGPLQSFLRRSLTTSQYVLLFSASVLIALTGAIFYAVRRIRDRRAARYTAMAFALTIGSAYLWAVGTPYPEVNAVERVHFVEYGLIAMLFYRAWRPAGDLSIVMLPLLVAFMVGTLDEWLQWFIPVRVGEAHDVFLNLVSIGCGLMFAIALDPPDRFSMSLRPRTRVQAPIIVAVVWLVFAAFVGQVHLGYTITLDAQVSFRSHYTAAELDALQRDRGERWRTDPPRVLERLSQEDQYLDEGLWHVRSRNGESGVAAWRENLILERFFAPVLDTSTYASPEGNRLSAEQRAAMAATVDQNAPPYSSGAEPYPIVTWSHALYWSVVAAVTLVCLATSMFAKRQGNVEQF